MRLHDDPLCTLYLGDCVEVMAELPAESVDAIVTDPPYGLEFMGKEWDRLDWRDGGGFSKPGIGERSTAWTSFGGETANPTCATCGGRLRGAKKCGCAEPDWRVKGEPMTNRTAERSRLMQSWHEAWAREAFRVAKPGAHLLAFGGTRTYHRLASAIEDAGWEIRDCLVWAYASGFPKSLDVSKAIDKARDDRHAEALPVTRAIRVALASSGLTRRDLNRACGLGDNDAGSAQSWVTETADGAHKPRVPTVEQWAILRDLLGLQELDAEVWRLNGRKGTPGENWDKREVIGSQIHARSGGQDFAKVVGSTAVPRADDVTAPATPDAEKWDGWGTALKPAWEPIVMARKPLRGTVAANVLAFGTGAINVDATRIGTGGGTTRSHQAPYGESGWRTGHDIEDIGAGRWPANLILTDPIFDGDTPGVVGGGAVNGGGAFSFSGERAERDNPVYGKANLTRHSPDNYGDSGTYSRFFLIPKSSRSDREPVLRGQLAGVDDDPDGSFGLDGARPHTKPDYQYQRKVRANSHPTVKPLDLMRHLVRLVTPPGGTVLDCFLGSGTTAIAANAEGFRCIGIEKEREYLDIALARMLHEPLGLGLDVAAPTRRVSTKDGVAVRHNSGGNTFGGDKAKPPMADMTYARPKRAAVPAKVEKGFDLA